MQEYTDFWQNVESKEGSGLKGCIIGVGNSFQPQFHYSVHQKFRYGDGDAFFSGFCDQRLGHFLLGGVEGSAGEFFARGHGEGEAHALGGDGCFIVNAAAGAAGVLGFSAIVVYEMQMQRVSRLRLCDTKAT